MFTKSAVVGLLGLVMAGSSDAFGTVQPIFAAPSRNQHIYLQNNGHCLNAKRVDSSYSVEFAQISSLAKQQVWQYREDGRFMNIEFNQCLSMTEAGVFGLIGCDDPVANIWDFNWENGVWKEREWNKVVGFNNNKVFLRDWADNLVDPDLLWTPYAVYENVPVPSPEVITGTIQPMVPFSMQQSGNYLSVEYKDNRYGISVVQNPNLFQQQNWMLLQDGRLRNIIYNQCLAYINSALGLCGCDDSNQVGYWEYNYQHRSLYERKLRKAVALSKNSVSLREYSETSIDQSMKWEAYNMNRALRSSAAQDSSSAASTKAIVGASALLTGAAYLSSML
jgi:hypothetical protein